MSAVRQYTDKELLDKVKSLPSFRSDLGLPRYLLIGVRSIEDLPDQFDDKIYLFIDGVCMMWSECTTNAGKPVLVGGWKKHNSKGAAVVKADEIYYNVYQKSNGGSVPHHNGKMPCLRQVAPMKYYRDGNNDEKTDEVGTIETANNSTNVHFNNYDIKTLIKNMFVGGWSAGCQVLNDSEDYNYLLFLVPLNVSVTYALLKEF